MHWEYFAEGGPEKFPNIESTMNSTVLEKTGGPFVNGKKMEARIGWRSTAMTNK